jgi:hypothetical protein
MSKGYGVNVYLDYLDGQVQLSFDCPHYSDAHTCPYCMSDIMPPEEGCRCFFKTDGGGCKSLEAKQAALKKLLAHGKKELKELEEEARSGW